MDDAHQMGPDLFAYKFPSLLRESRIICGKIVKFQLARGAHKISKIKSETRSCTFRRTSDAYRHLTFVSANFPFGHTNWHIRWISTEFTTITHLVNMITGSNPGVECFSSHKRKMACKSRPWRMVSSSAGAAIILYHRSTALCTVCVCRMRWT